MKHAKSKTPAHADYVEEDDMLDEYDFSKGVRGATALRYAAGSNIVVLDPDVAAAFPNASTVNEALRLLARLARTTTAPRKAQKKARARKR